VLPCVDTPVRSNYFTVLPTGREIDLLPVALRSTLGFRIQSDQPDVVVIASEEFAASSWRKSDSLAEMLSGTPTILLTADVNTALKKRALRLHIRSVLPLDIGPHQILAAITATAAGLVVGLEHAEDESPEWNTFADEPPLFTEHLTAREMEVLRLMAGGYGNKQIAAHLNISEHTAKFHVSSVLAKLGAASRTEAVTLGITRGLVAI
jgi:DNA-binding NarL/FixJ family response regulator